jgi:hypothetical protein
MVLCKTCEAINGEFKCVVFLFFCVINLRDGVMCHNLNLGFATKVGACKGACEE